MMDDGPLKDFEEGARKQQLFMCVLLTGLLQTLCGVLQLAKLVQLIPQPAMLGFMNGLAIVIFTAQFSAFTECNYAAGAANPNNPDFGDCTADEKDWLPIDAGRTWITLLLV